jgi:hypothetical protein
MLIVSVHLLLLLFPQLVQGHVFQTEKIVTKQDPGLVPLVDFVVQNYHQLPHPRVQVVQEILSVRQTVESVIRQAIIVLEDRVLHFRVMADINAIVVDLVHHHPHQRQHLLLSVDKPVCLMKHVVIVDLLV